jgi:16S rRNA pseudouridine516 synthase
LVAAGRLDKWASGLLILSQNGDFVQRLTFPKKKHGAFGKVYHLQLQNPLTGQEAAIFASGQLMLRSEKTMLRPAKFEVIDHEERLVKYDRLIMEIVLSANF